MAKRNSRSITRVRSERRENDRVLVVTEGAITEVQYLQRLAQHLKASGLKVVSPKVKAGKRDPLGVLEYAQMLAGKAADEYDEIWIVVDVDDHATLDDCLLQASRYRVRVVVSNPCFEVWLLWHYADHDKYCKNSELSDILKRHGIDSKHIPNKFPFDSLDKAIIRAGSEGRKVMPGAKGANPSSAMPALISKIRGH